jgi:hypothetical protein
MQNVDQKIIRLMEHAGNVAYDNSMSVETLIEYSYQFVLSAWRYLDVDAANEYVQDLSAKIEQLYCLDKGEE